MIVGVWHGVFFGLGLVALYQEEYQKAKKFCEKSYLIMNAIGNKYVAGTCLERLGDLALLMDEHKEAQARYQEALSVRRDVGHEGDIANSIADLGNVALSIGEYEIAKERFLEAFASFQSLDNQIAVGWVLSYLGDLAAAMGDHQDARTKYHSAMEIGVATQNAGMCLSVLAGSAGLYEHAGNAGRAVELASLAQRFPESGLIAPLFTQQRAKKLLDELCAKLPPETFTEFQERGKALDLWNTVDEVLTELDV